MPTAATYQKRRSPTPTALDIISWGGWPDSLAEAVKMRLGVKVRGIELSLLQRAVHPTVRPRPILKKHIGPANMR